MFTWFIIGALVLFAVLCWIFFVRPVREQAKVRTLLRNSQKQRRNTIYTQSVVVEPEAHLTGRAYGVLLRMAHGDRHKVEFWVVEMQRKMPGVSRSEIVEMLAERALNTSVATA